ncbi:MAG: dihydroorotase [Flavobacteriales bacterium]
MKLLIKQVTIIDNQSEFDQQIVDIFIENQKIKSISKHIDSKEDVEEIDAKGQFLTPAGFDLIGSIPEPGEEHKESIESGALAALHGGFSSIGLLAHELAPADKVEQIVYLKSKSKLVDIQPIGALTNQLKAENMSELFDMQQHGAIAFAQNREFVQNAELMKTVLEYSKNFNGLIFSFPYDYSICKEAMIHEGEISVQMGLKGIPSRTEQMGVQRDLVLADYADVPIHFACISTKEAVEQIREAKAKGFKVSASVAALNIAFSDEVLLDFDPRFKVQPPLRSETDREALINGLLDGTIDCIVSNHQPQDQDAKFCEFSRANYGVSTYQSVISSAFEVLKDKMNLADFMALFNHKPKALAGLESSSIQEGIEANLCLFSTENPYKLEKSDWKSKSKESPLIGKTYHWKAQGIYNKGQWKTL